MKYFHYCYDKIRIGEINIVMNCNNHLKIAAMLSYFTIAFNIVAGLIYTPWVINEIGQADYGLYTLSLSLISIFAIDFGLGAAVARFISKYRAQNNQKKVSEFLGITYKLYLIIDLIILLILIITFFFIDKIYSELTYSELIKFKNIYLLSGLFTIVSFPFNPLNGILIAHENFIQLKGLDLLQKFFTIIFMIISLLLGYGLYALVFVNIIVGILLIIIKLLYIKKKNYYKVDYSCKDKKILKEIFSFSTWTTVIGIFQRLILNITPSILAIFSGTTQIAIFSIGMTIEGYAYTFSSALSGLFLPKVTNIIYDYDNSKGLKKVEDLMIKVGRIQLLIIGAIISIFISIGKDFVVVWMGKDFEISYIVALLLILPLIITVTQEIANTMLIATNQIKYDAICTVITAMISLIFSFIFTKYLGVIGSSLAIFIGNVIGRIIVKNYIFSKVLRLNMKRFFIECHWRMFFPIFTTSLLGICLSFFGLRQKIYIFILKGVVLIVYYLFIMWFLVLNKSEKEMFIRLFQIVNNKIYKTERKS